MSVNKSADKADIWRNDGNESFNKGDFLEALVAYNKSLCHAPPGSQQLGLAYGNRSAVYLKAKMFRKSLQNVQLAREHGYPTDKLAKLNEREQKCLKLMEQNVETDRLSFFKLSHPANEKIPFIASCIKLRESEKFGRYVITTSDLKPGDIIAIDEPIYKFVDVEVRQRRCAHCMKSNELSLIPCESCADALYCSTDCRDKHNALIHQIECGKEILTESKALATQMVLSALSVAGSVEKLRELLTDSTCKTLFDFDWSQPGDPSYKTKVLLTINALSTVRETELTKSAPMDEMFTKPPFDSLLKSDGDRKFIRKFARNQMKILDTNLYDMKEHSRVKTSDLDRRTFGQSIGSGLCLFASLFSHSCDPMVKRITVENKIAFVVVRPVAAGEQLFISYGYSSYSMSREHRREYLKSYGFVCDCEACARNYLPLMHQERMIPQYIEPVNQTMTMQAAVAELKKTCKIIDDIFQLHPCYETTDLMIYCDHLLHQISKLSLEEIGLSKAA